MLNVNFYDRAGWQIEKGNTIKLHIDNFGNLYPGDGSFKNYNVKRDIPGGLYNHAVDRRSNLCKQIDPTVEIEGVALCEAVPEEGCDTEKNKCPVTNAWKAQQTKLWLKAANKIYKTASVGETSKTLVFLIHGYNTDDASKEYEIAKRRIEDIYRDKDNLLFIEIHWDGFYGELADGIRIWGIAQAAGPLVGFQLRQLFNGIIDEFSKKDELTSLKVRVVTHSSGAFVIGSTFGNPTAAQPLLQKSNGTDLDWELFQKNVNPTSGKYVIPKMTNLRVGMLAPATPTNTFAAYQIDEKGNIKTDINKALGWLAREAVLIFSVNEHDKVLNKFFLIPSYYIGATTTGADIGFFCSNLDDGLNQLGVQHYGIDFKQYWWPRWEDHAFTTYLTQPESKLFFETLLGTEWEKDSTYIKCD